MFVAACSRKTYSVTDATVAWQRAGWELLSWDEQRAARRALCVVSSIDGREAKVLLRERTADAVIDGRSLAHVVALYAATRAELVRVDDTFRCDGSRCERPHALIRPADALALGCRAFFDALAPRLGTLMLASAFAALGVSSPAVSENPEARSRLASHGDGWRLTLDDALALARALRAHPGPESSLWNEALVPRFGDPGPLRGAVAMDERDAWFVGYSVGSAERLVVCHVAECEGRAGAVALHGARSVFESLTRLPSSPRTPAASSARRRVR
jgi:hypothetical protein